MHCPFRCVLGQLHGFRNQFAACNTCCCCCRLNSDATCGLDCCTTDSVLGAQVSEQGVVLLANCCACIPLPWSTAYTLLMPSPGPVLLRRIVVFPAFVDKARCQHIVELAER